MKFLLKNKTKDPTESIGLEPGLYEDVTKMVKAKSEEYPDIKSFIESAVKYKIHRIKFNLENYDSIVSKDGKLLGSSNRAFTWCPICGSLFLNKKERNQLGKYVCQRCSVIVKYFSKRL